MTAGLWLLLWVFALLVGSLLSALSQSLRDLSRTAMETLLESRGRPGDRERVARILEDHDGHAAAVALPRILCYLVAGLGIVMWITTLRGLALPTWVEASIGLVVTSILLWVAGTVVPAAVARHAAESTVAGWSPIIRAAYLVLRPLLSLSTLTDEIVRRMTGRTQVSEKEEIQEEILDVVEEGRQEGQFDEFEKRMIQAVVSFRDLAVAQIMTPRTEIDALPVTTNLGEVVAHARKGGHSRVPVYEGDLDHVLGVFYVKDLMRWLAGERVGGGGRGFDLRSVLRPAHFVPETKTVRELLGELLAKRVHIAIVADEFGGTAGLVTLEDIFEEVFGDVQDEYEKPGTDAGDVRVDLESKSAEVDARTYVSDVNPRLEPVGIEIPESPDYDTVAGFVTVTMGRIPAVGETFRHNGLRVTVTNAEPTHVTRVKLEAVPADPEDAPAGHGSERSAGGK